MNFSTPVTVSPADHQADYNSDVVLLGSCFAVNIAEKFYSYKFRNIVNPFGILFHPLAIDEMVHRCVNDQQFSAGDLFHYNGRWHSFDVHSDLSHSDQQIMLKTLNKRLSDMRDALVKSTHIIITYGTAWIYREKASKSVVANCHKMSASQFDKEILSADSIEAAVSNTVNSIRSINPNAQIIFTISPVRHIKDGMVENQRSKAHMISALHNFLDGNQDQQLSYFPAYEILMDELRDYRFYAEDMIHPSKTAVDFIWQRFTETWISAAAYPVMEDVLKVQKALSHRPFNPDSESHRQFLNVINSKIDVLTSAYPHIRF
jgi:hypothetical protein